MKNLFSALTAIQVIVNKVKDFVTPANADPSSINQKKVIFFS